MIASGLFVLPNYVERIYLLTVLPSGVFFCQAEGPSQICEMASRIFAIGCAPILLRGGKGEFEQISPIPTSVRRACARGRERGKQARRGMTRGRQPRGDLGREARGRSVSSNARLNFCGSGARSKSSASSKPVCSMRSEPVLREDLNLSPSRARSGEPSGGYIGDQIQTFP